MFQTPITVAKVLEGIHNNEYVLPAIQREFVWGPEKIQALFDSLMRGYPIGGFLFWKVSPKLSESYTFYGFLTDYHEKNNPYAQVKHLTPGQGTTAILDGQQRLTALNIGLYGSHAERLPKKRANNPDAYPKKQLYLNLLDGPDVDEQGMAYEFRFLTDAEAKPEQGAPDTWYLVRDVLKLKDAGPAINDELLRRRVLSSSDTVSFTVLYNLYHAIRAASSINFFLEEAQDPDKVLDIFVRANSGGIPLSYSDLLLSMATNQWQDLDAREVVRSTVQELNDVGAGFAFSKDLVLKAGLVLTDVKDIGFKVSNFTQANMAQMEKSWSSIRASLTTAADLLASFGYSARTVTADSVMIPIAYYIQKRGCPSTYVTSSADAADRARVRMWVTRSLMKRGIWGSGLDTVLGRIRDAIRLHGDKGFPSAEIEAAMLTVGKSLKFEDAELNELLDLQHGSKRVFPVLATLYPGLDFTKSFHEDHIFPRSLFTKPRLTKAGVPQEQIAEYLAIVDNLANLQLLGGGPNIEKQAKLPAEWLNGPHFPVPQAREQYILDNDLDDLPTAITGFLTFCAKRRLQLEARLKVALGVS